MYARLSDCVEWHKDYLRLQGLKRDLEILGNDYPKDVVEAIEERQERLVTLLGYTPRKPTW